MYRLGTAFFLAFMLAAACLRACRHDCAAGEGGKGVRRPEAAGMIAGHVFRTRSGKEPGLAVGESRPRVLGLATASRWPCMTTASVKSSGSRELKAEKTLAESEPNSAVGACSFS